MTAETGGPPGSGRVVLLPDDLPHRVDPATVASVLAGPQNPEHTPARARVLGAGLNSRDRLLAGLVRSAAGAHLVAFICGLVGADYVESSDFSLILPLLSGLACGWLVSRLGRGLRRPVRDAMAGGYGAASAACAFVYSDTPYGSLGTWGPPLLAGVAGALLWPLVDPAPPGRATARP